MMRLSVIVPVYNVARFIERGIGQLSAQSLDGEWEILLVDDGSTDGSAEMIDRLASAMPHVHAYHQRNAGAGAARNLGISQAQGEYVWFYDIDDLIEPSLLAEIDGALKLNGNPDLLVFGFDEYDIILKTTTPRTFRDINLQSNDELRKVWIREFSGVFGGSNGFVWNKVYRRSFLTENAIEFGNERIQQDEVFNLQVYAKVQTVVSISRILYHYQVYSSGNTRSHYIPDRLDIYRSVMASFRNLLDKWHLSDEDMERWLARRFFSNVVTVLAYNCYHKECPMNVAERRVYIENVMAQPDVQRLMTDMHKLRIYPNGFTSKCYASAIGRHSVALLSFARNFEKVTVNIKKSIHKLLRR